MKHLSLVFILIMFSCKTSENVVKEPTDSEVFIYYSKGRCLGKCPVYDLWIHKDGTVVYQPIENIGKKGKYFAKLSPTQLDALQAALAEDFEVASFKRVRDLPVTRLKHGLKDHKYYASKIEGQLKKVNTLLESIVSSIS